MRKIVHVDMDAFYAAVEQRDRPKLRGLPVAVGGAGERGVVMTASYEARRFGVGSAMPMAHARRLCPDLVIVPPSFDAYHEASRAIRAIFHRYTDLVEPLSLDEAYLDVTHPLQGPPSATILARLIKAAIRDETGLTASAGVANGKFLAKVASGMHKPDGLTVVRPEEAEAFVAALPIERFFGVGPKTAERMRSLGIHTGADLRRVERAELEARFGKAGTFLYRIARADDPRPVVADRERKSIGAERTFERDVENVALLEEALGRICDVVLERLERSALAARTVSVKIKYRDFRVITRSHTPVSPVTRRDDVWPIARSLAFDAPRPPGSLRLLGVTLSRFLPRAERVVQPALAFFADEEDAPGGGRA
jgi:DNA polymerase IV